MTAVDSETPRSATRAVSWKALLTYSASRVVPAIIMFAATPVLVGLFGTAQYGLYTTVTALVLVAQSLGVGWLRQSALRGTGDAGQAMGLLPRWSILAAVSGPTVLVAISLYAISSQLHAAGDPALLPTATALCAATGLYVLLMTRAQRDLQAGRVALAEAVRAAIGLLATIVLHALWFKGAAAALAGMTVGSLAAALVMMRPPRQSQPPLTRQSANSLLRLYWIYGWPMSLWLAASSALLYVDRLMLSLWLDPETVGQYAAVADTVVRGFSFIAGPVSMAMHPVIMSAWNRGRPDVALGTLAAYQKILGLVLMAATVVVLVVGQWLIPVAVGVAAPPVTVLFFLVLGSAIWQYSLLTQKRLELAGRTLAVLSLMGVALLLTVVVDIALIPAAGPLGAAIGLAAGAAAYQAGCLHFGRKAIADKLERASDQEMEAIQVQRGGPVNSSVS